ncbi:SDR family oxidoreductase [Amycolatopsis rubida]|uniref:SDR family oxidoreductase n=1 Tax=Amycolatopsis rubida TaxID=112413 RepID=A0A1I5LC17_9PSEU|nr:MULTISPECIES: SDR family oxidoreductase [Amycolatopsis]MYW89570.1 SDR family oxidoreductase [Amycolatopsis rubida]NEC54547.1 SDR family oxidoreductase [Amycolatopsis rubida]OAP25324.1 3-alpha-hydroxysteroid dehydrogenase/carbonyl reductase [Amycolatopsis sp. M39]SFO94798.1 Short-chain dehydrogenase [Amycolatopsis rubida]
MPRTVVVTGASSGIGAALSGLLAERGDQVLGVDLAGSDVDADLSTPRGRAAAAEEVGKRTGHVDAVVACAGTANPGEAMVTVNYFGSTEFVEALQPLLAKSEGPRVVLVGSISGTQPNDPAVVEGCLRGDEQAALTAAREAIADNRALQLYPSSKSAIAQWARRTSVSAGWADAGIAVNVVAPGVVRTPMTDELFADPKMKAVMDKAVPMPLHGYAAAEDVARVLAYFADAATTHITGQVVYVDGGAEATLRPAAHY